MQHRRVSAVVGLVLSLLSVESVLAQGAPQPLVGIETVYPRHVARGQKTVINVAVPSRDLVQGAEITPAAGVTVSAIKGSSSETEQAVGWWEITLDVAGDAAVGNRSLVLVMRAGRSVPATISIPTHLPAISDLSVSPPQSNQPTYELRLTAADAAGDLGESPYVWFMAGCGGEPIAGAVRGKASAGIVRATLPNLRTVAGAGAQTGGRCDLQVRVTDAPGIEGNTLKTTVEFTNAPAAASPAVPTPSTAQDWTEFSSRDDRFTVVFPGQPTITETTWVSQFSAILPVRVYLGARGASRFSVTVVDYNPAERLLSERSRSLPALDLAVHVYGLGYWKTDVRSAVVYAMSKFMERDAKITSVLANFSDLVAGLLVDLINTADQSRTFASIYMHENRLVITEATVPRGDPPPTIFQQSLGWIDENGTRLRYQYIYYNDPDGPKPRSGGGL